MNSGKIHANGDVMSIAACMMRAMMSIADSVEAKATGAGNVFLGMVGMELMEMETNKPKGEDDDGTDQT